MAYTASFLVKNYAIGNSYQSCIRVTADAASGAIDTGFKVVDFLQHSPQSCATAGMRVFANANSGLTALNGSVAFSGCSGGDVMFLTVLGH